MIMTLIGEYREFSLKTFFFTTGESVIATLRAFRAYFTLRRYDAVLDRKSILLWVENFSSSIKRKPDLKALEFQTMSRLWDGLLGSLLYIQPVDMFLLYDCLIEQSEEFYRPVWCCIHSNQWLFRNCRIVTGNIARDTMTILFSVPANSVLLTCDEGYFNLLSGCVNKQNVLSETALSVAITDYPVWKNVSKANTRCIPIWSWS